MSTSREQVEQLLREYPLCRERSRKDEGLVVLLLRKHGLKRLIDEGYLSKETVIAMVQDYATYDRAWRKTLQEIPELRGSDYDSKDELERIKQEELGYNVKKQCSDVGAKCFYAGYRDYCEECGTKRVEAAEVETQPKLI